MYPRARADLGASIFVSNASDSDQISSSREKMSSCSPLQHLTKPCRGIQALWLRDNLGDRGVDLLAKILDPVSVDLKADGLYAGDLGPGRI